MYSFVQYTYDALNRRVTKFISDTSELTTYIYDAGQVIEEYIDGQFERAYVYGTYIDDPIMLENNAGESYYYLKDRQFSVTALTDDDGNVVETYEYSAFGLMQILDANGVEINESAFGNPYGYTGRRRDRETGLWYYRNRMYSPTLGRFLQRDPAGYVDGANLYAYVRNNPLGYLDPWGLESQSKDGSIFDFGLAANSLSNFIKGAGEAAFQMVYEPLATVYDLEQAVYYSLTGNFEGYQPSSTIGHVAESGTGTWSILWGMSKGIVNVPVEYGKAIISGDPERIGAATLNFETLLYPAGKGAGALKSKLFPASKKGFRDMMSPEEAARYDKYWTKKAPTESTPYSTYRRYTPEGDIKQVTTYDKYGNRQSQFDLKDKYGRDPHRHDFKYDENHQRPSYGARDKDYKPLDNIPDY